MERQRHHFQVHAVTRALLAFRREFLRIPAPIPVEGDIAGGHTVHAVAREKPQVLVRCVEPLRTHVHAGFARIPETVGIRPAVIG